MKTLAIYALEVLACSGVLLAAYAILLERHVRFGWCRAYLLASTLLAAVIPLLRIPVWPGKVIEVAPTVTLPAAEWTAEVVEEAAPAVTPEAICLAVYLIGVGLVAGVMLWQVVRIRRLRRGAAITRTERFTLVRTPQRIASFSFFRSIYLWDQIPAGELQAIVAHEASHVAHRHSAERVAMECMKAVLWWNPFVWLAARRLTEAEEFEADSDVLAEGYDIEHYMKTIFRQLFGYSPEIANGLCFSVADGVPFPPSLQNIFKEVSDDTGTPIPSTGNLDRWAEQGVLLLNAVLTVRAHEAASHAGRGWETFTDAVVRAIAQRKEGIVYMLWGSYAQKKGAIADPQRNLILKAVHPSPLSVYRGFFGCRHFSRANEYLRSVGKEPIVW